MVDNSTAYIGNEGRYTVFTNGEERLKFIAPYSLERYIKVKEWNNGYIVVDTKYSHSDEPVEEYIDLIPILNNLMIDKETFLSQIKRVEVVQ